MHPGTSLWPAKPLLAAASRPRTGTHAAAPADACCPQATQAQNLLECIARTSSGMSQGGRLSNLSSPHAGAVPSSPPSWTAPPPHFSNT